MSKHWELRDGVIYAFSRAVYDDFNRHGCRVVLVEEAEPVEEEKQ